MENLKKYNDGKITELAIKMDNIMSKIDYEYPYDLSNNESIEELEKDIYNGEVENYIVFFKEFLDEQKEDLKIEIVDILQDIITELLEYM